MLVHGPDLNCQLCPRLAQFRDKNRQLFPHFYNAPVPAFTSPEPPTLLIVGLAPGLRGANCTGRPFTNDFAGDLLFDTLLHFDFAEGQYERRTDDTVRLKNCRITNAVRCVPPENKPTPAETKTCNTFLKTEIASLPHIRAIVALGNLAHNAILKALELRASSCAFKHGAIHKLRDDLMLFDSYHCSRYNVNTGRLTKEMFFEVFAAVRQHFGPHSVVA